MAIHPEALLISSLVRTGEYQQLAASGVSSSMFHVHQEEMEWIENYIARTSRTPSKAAVKQQFPELVVYKVDDTHHWCDEVRKEHKRQALVDIMDAALTMSDQDEDAALSMIEQGIANIVATSGGIKPDFDLYSDFQSVYEEVSERVIRVRSKGYAGIPTGFKTLDDITGGFQPGWFCVYAARLSQGKTWTGLRSAWAAAEAGFKVTYFSLEQSKFQIATRVHAFGSRKYAKQVFNPLDLNKGTGFDLREYKKFLMDMRDQQQNKQDSGQFHINDTSRGLITPRNIATVIEAKQPDIVFIDYITLMAKKADDWTGAADLSASLQGLGQKYMVPVVGLSQINRLGAGRTPPSADTLSQSDALGQDADLVVTMAQQSRRVQKFRIAKFRHGPGADTMWNAQFSPGEGIYDDISQKKADKMIEEDQEDD